MIDWLILKACQFVEIYARESICPISNITLGQNGH